MVCRMAVTSDATRSQGSGTRVFRGEWVRSRMKDCGYARIADLAAAAEISRQTLHYLLATKYLPNNETSHKLATALRCMVEDLTEPAGAE
jgi:DNA-binding XRE family transcriptional regulator